MKRVFKTAIICLCLVVAVSFAYAGRGRGGNGRGGGGGMAGARYVDNNGDGICDNTGQAIGQGRGAGRRGSGRGAKDGTGPINRSGGVPGANYVDKNGDGICDNSGGSGHGLVGPPAYGPAYSANMNLSPEQREKVNILQQKFSKEILPIRNELALKAQELRTFMVQQSLDEGAIAAKQQEIIALRQKLLRKTFTKRLELRKILTPQQVSMWPRGFVPGFRPCRGMGYGRGMGPGGGIGRSMGYKRWNCPFEYGS